MARYELVDRIGVGGMAEIFRGKLVAGGGFEKPVAIKRILPHLSQDKRFVELLIAEAKTLSQLRHRNVVQIYDVGLGDDGQYFLVMEFVDGADLGALQSAMDKASIRLPLETALHLVGEVCEALDHAHRARGSEGEPLGLVHRDVTPSNILVSRSGEVKLTDFGIAKRMEEATGHGAVRGKFAYISPEQAMNAHVDARSDVYSLGIILYELVLGRRLYSALPDFDALRMVREARAIRPADVDPDIDPALATLIATALAPAPADRFPSAGQFGLALRTYRYALESSVGDPALEIARLVRDHRRGRLESSLPQRESTVVRIATAVGFKPGIAELGDDGERPETDDLFDDEETHSSAEVEPLLVAPGALAPDRRRPAPDLSLAPLRGDDMADLATRRRMVVPRAAAARDREGADATARVSPSPSPTTRRATTPPDPSFVRRHVVAIGIGGCVAVAIAAVVTGTLLGDPSSTDRADAGEQLDAGPVGRAAGAPGATDAGDAGPPSGHPTRRKKRPIKPANKKTHKRPQH